VSVVLIKNDDDDDDDDDSKSVRGMFMSCDITYRPSPCAVTLSWQERY